ncbi:aminotransferase class I/II-fold pyridoxal phosphate-dependent enzyme [Flavobacterium agrisoli]|uniref:Pyridoxal phosphate-dependent aminotransferase family protein n=1 Tax=Flavobacterium agrisoli TaxID=2793066 RepID=A0A934PMY5_9FLAO|nr:pyridoxal phosphate-dependent aminotransferase family protein [Flavobacterium agrisoli]MBK0369441.1 pyridoxal phosphate-dependent aminotransferase family protein [Flavobacterium agrisoli]
MKIPENLNQKLLQRQESQALRSLPKVNSGIDFASNDYLGFSQNETIFDNTHEFLKQSNCKQNGATGSRLLSGNHFLYELTEQKIAEFHQVESALLFNSGYDANVGFFSAVPQRNEIILFDELVHASIRDGISLSKARSYKFSHNDLEDLERLFLKFSVQKTAIFVATESVFSMDGDSPNLEELVLLCEKYQAYLIVDEAHALGVFGNKGDGLVQMLGLQNRVFAQIMTFGKGLGCHGAAVLGSSELSTFLVNFARSFIYTTGLSPHAVATILMAYQQLESEKEALQQLRENILYFNQQKKILGLQPLVVRSKSAIQSAIIPGNSKVKAVAKQLQNAGFDVKAILSPTVPEGQERLRFCLHAYNSKAEIETVLMLLQSCIY